MPHPDTRKTTPGLQLLEKYAVPVAAASITAWRSGDMYREGTTTSAARPHAGDDRIQRTRRDLLLEVEVESMEQLREALRPEVDRILVDNQPVDAVKRAVDEVERWYCANPLDHSRAARREALAGSRSERRHQPETVRAYARPARTTCRSARSRTGAARST